MCDSMACVDIYFSKLPTPEQLVAKAAGVIQRSKNSLCCVTLSYKNDTITLVKDKDTKQWTGTGKICNINAKEII